MLALIMIGTQIILVTRKQCLAQTGSLCHLNDLANVAQVHTDYMIHHSLRSSLVCTTMFGLSLWPKGALALMHDVIDT